MFTLNNGKTVGSIYDDDKYLLSKILVETMRKLGHPPSFEEAKKQEGMPENPNIYAIYFGSLKKACEVAEYYAEIAEKPTRGRIVMRDSTKGYARAYLRRRPYSTDKLTDYLTTEDQN